MFCSQAVGAGEEIQLADATNLQPENNAIEFATLNGRRIDCGSVEDYIEAIKYVVSDYKSDQSYL